MTDLDEVSNGAKGARSAREEGSPHRGASVGRALAGGMRGRKEKIPRLPQASGHNLWSKKRKKEAGTKSEHKSGKVQQSKNENENAKLYRPLVKHGIQTSGIFIAE